MRFGSVVFFILGGVLLGASLAGADDNDMRVNEVAWMGTQESHNHEWIELFNSGDEEVSLVGWVLEADDGQPLVELAGSIPPGGYYLMERTSDETLPGVTADLIYTGSLGNGGETLRLLGDSGTVVEEITAQDGWPAGDNGNKATMERSADGGWQTSQESGGTPGSANSQGAGEPSDPGPAEEEEENNALPKPNSQPQPPADNQDDYGAGDILISEFVSDPADGENEWVEIWNQTSGPVDLAGWQLREGAGSVTTLSGQLNDYYIINKPKGNLNNNGDRIELVSPAGRLVDEVVYGDWDGNGSDENAPAPEDPMSLALDPETNQGFELTITPTPGAANRITQPEKIDASPESSRHEPIITEILSNPEGSDENSEFIEFHNPGSRVLDLAGWRIGDESRLQYEIVRSFRLEPGEYKVVYRKASGIAFNNNGDTVKLFRPGEDKVCLEIDLPAAKAGLSYCRTDFGTSSNFIDPAVPWVWSPEPTPGALNRLRIPNHPPEAAFSFSDPVRPGEPVLFDGSDSIDLDGDNLRYLWDFDDGIMNKLSVPAHTFLKSGEYEVKLYVSDSQATTTVSQNIKVGKAGQVGAKQKTPSLNKGVEVVISEIMPSPVGSDEENEWIELYNQGDVSVNLLDWRLEDASETVFSWREDELLRARNYYLLGREKSGIALNNAGDTLRLFEPGGSLIDSVTYQSAPEGLAYGLGENGKWFWTVDPTPGAENRISSGYQSAASPRVKSAGALIQAAAGSGSESGDYPLVPLEKVREHEPGEKISVRGTVAVLPGVLGLQYFYIVEPGGLEIYNYAKDFPELGVGDMIEAKGEISRARGEYRLKTGGAEDIRVMANLGPPEPLLVTSADLAATLPGQLVEFRGKVVERKGSRVYMDDGQGELLVYLTSHTGIDSTIFQEGSEAAVSGILSSSEDGFRLLPRSMGDVEIMAAGQSTNKEQDEPVPGETEKGKVLGEVSAQSDWELPARDSQAELYKYLLILALAVIAGLAGYIFLEKRNDA